MCRGSFSRIVTWKKGLHDRGHGPVAEHVRDGAIRRDKGMLKEERRINSQSLVVKSVRECGPRERERWNRGYESCKLTI